MLLCPAISQKLIIKTVNTPTTEVAKIQYRNGVETVIDSLTLYANKEVQKELNLSKPAFVYFKFKSAQKKLFVSPKSTLYVTINDVGGKDSINVLV